MRKFTFLAGFLLMLCTSNLSAQIEVLSRNEFGRIFDLTYSLKDQNTIYATTLTSHIVVSHDNGVSWNIFYALPSVGSGSGLSKLDISKDGSFLTFTTVENNIGVLHILDISTKKISKSYYLPNQAELPYVNAYNFLESDKKNLIVSSQFSDGFGIANRVYLTNDGGITWKEIYYSGDHNKIITSDVAFAPNDKNKIYIANGNGSEGLIGGLLISNDSGDHFIEKLSGNVLSTLEFNPTNAEEIYAGTGISFGSSPENIFHSADGGENWDRENITFGTNGILNNIIAIKFNPLDKNHIIVLEEDEIISTKDGGATWQNVEYPYDNLDSYYYGMKASFNPFKAGELVITSNYKPLFTTDNGKNLTQIKTPYYSSTGPISLFKNSSGLDLFFSVQGGFVHRNLISTSEVAHQIMPLNMVNNSNSNIYLSDSRKRGRLYSFRGGFTGATLAVSDDFGTIFTPVFETLSSGLTNVIADPKINNKVFATFSNFGQGELNTINFNDLNNIVVNNIPLPTQKPVYKILHPNQISNEFFILIGSEVYRTVDGGDQWIPVQIGNEIFADSSIYDIVQDPHNDKNMAIGTSEGVFISDNKGLTWKNVSDFATNKITYSNTNAGVLIATTYTGEFEIFNIRYSVNNGESWKIVDRADLLETESNSVAIHFSDRKAYLYIASADLGLLGYNLNLNTLANTDITLKNENVLVYPNPAVDVIRINSTNLRTVAIYDISGKKLLESNKTEMNVSSLPKGVYILKIITLDNSVTSRKLIKK